MYAQLNEHNRIVTLDLKEIHMLEETDKVVALPALPPEMDEDNYFNFILTDTGLVYDPIQQEPYVSPEDKRDTELKTLQEEVAALKALLQNN